MSLVRPPPLSGPHWDYQRFVILGQQRCGTTMLVSALNSHRRITCHGEIFHPRAFDGRSLERSGRAVRARRFKKLVRDMVPITYAHGTAYHGYEAGTAAVGFKLMLDQLISFRKGALVTFLLSNDDIKLIHVWRHNVLERYLSALVARRLRVTYSSRGTPLRPRAMRLDPAKCEADFERIHEGKEHIQRTFAGPRLFTVAYEGLVSDPRQAYGEVQEHIGVEAEPILPGTQKQGVWPVEELISNYAELARHFAGTRWAYCFAARPL
jgi:LPS sulfotransferase NodH